MTENNGEGNKTKKKLSIAMVSDFFYPGLGGVEMHIYNVAQCLITMGHKVIVITHYRGGKKGIRYFTNGLKVYYLPIRPFVDQVTFPTIIFTLPWFRYILIRENINIIHSHQGTSTLAVDAVFHAKTMGYKVLYTDHSLFGFADAACIHINKVLRMYLADADHALAVSYTNKENLVLRAGLNPNSVSVIPNAVDSTLFTPNPSLRNSDSSIINIVVLSRLTYRKGIDLLADVIPYICARYSNVHWIIGGDGPKRLLLEETREKHKLHSRMELLGSIPHSRVKDVLRRGNIFVNSSLTEAFCIAIVEAAACGLLVVSTNVGGVPEVLPDDMVLLSDPDYLSMCGKIEIALERCREVNPFEFHKRVGQMYSWFSVAERTEKVYMSTLEKGERGEKGEKGRDITFMERLERTLANGPVAGLIWGSFILMNTLFLMLVEYFWPESEIEKAPYNPGYFALDEEREGEKDSPSPILVKEAYIEMN